MRLLLYSYEEHKAALLVKVTMIALSLNVFVCSDLIGQYSSPTIDGNIVAGEYGIHTDGQNQNSNGGLVTFLTWDATNLYVAITNANVGEALVMYLDKDPQIPVNSGSNSNGTTIGFSYDGTSFASLQFRADLVLYAKNGYKEYRIADGANGWSTATTGWGLYSDNGQFNGTGVQELAIPWSSVGGIPSSFNFFLYKTGAGGFVYNQQPAANAGGNIGMSARWERYYTVTSTANGSATKPFSRDCYVFNLAASNNSFGAISVYDFTMNTSGLQISRGSTTGNWNISGNLVVGAGTVSFGSGAASYGTTSVGNINVTGGALNMDQTNQPLNVIGNCIVNGGSLTLSGQSGGDLNVGGNFTNSGTFTHNNRAITFNGAAAQTISGTLNGTGATNILTNVTITNTVANVTAASNINISNSLTINTNARLDIGTNTLTLNTGSTSTVSGFLRNAGIISLSGTATLTFSSSGTYEHNFSASGSGNLGSIPTATWNTGSTCLVMGITNPTAGSWFSPASSAAQSFSNFTWNTPLLGSANAPNMSGAILSVSGTFSMISTGSSELRLGTGTTTGAINCGAFSQTGGILNLSNGTGTGTINCKGTFAQTSGLITELSSGSGIINLIQSSGTQNLTISGTVSNNITWNVGNGTTTNTVQLNSNLNAGSGFFNVLNSASMDFLTYVLSGNNNFNLQSGATLITANTNGLSALGASGSVQSTGTRIFNAAANYTYNGSSGQITGSGVTASNNLTINNSSGVTLSTGITVSNMLFLQSGLLTLGANNILITNNSVSAISGAGSASYIKTNSSGELRRAIATAGFPANYIFPVGITSYTPVSYNFLDNTVATNLHVRVVESTHPSVSTTDYIQNRYWITDLSDATGSYTYSATYNFVSGDVTGSQSNIRLSRWNGSSWGSVANSSSTGTTVTSGTVTEASAPLQATAQWCGRSSPASTTYSWNITGMGSWTTSSNWMPAGVPSDGDAVTFNNSSSSIITNTPTGIRLTKFSVSGSTSVTLQAASLGTLNIGGGSAPQFNVASSSILIIGSSASLALNIVSGNIGTVQGAIQLKEGANKLTAESVNGLTFNSGSYFAAGVSGGSTYSGNPFGINGTSSTVVFQSGSVFEQFEGSNPFASTQPSSKVSFQAGSLYKYSNTNAVAVPSFSGRTYANFEYNVNQLKSVSGGSGFSVQNLTVSQGTFNIGLTGASSITGNISVASATALNLSPASATTINLNGSTQNITINNTGIFSLGSNANLSVASGTAVNMISESAITGTGAFVLNSGATLGIASINGISSSGSTGNIRTNTRNFDIGGNYNYNGSSNQITGTGLPTSLTGTLTIANTGSSGNNTVSLTNSGSSASILNLLSGKFAIGTGQQFNIYNSGTVKGTGGDFSSGNTGGILNFNGSGTFTGDLNPYDVYVSGGVNFGTGIVTIQNGGTFRINNGGYADINAPYYAAGSTLLYNAAVVYNLRTEWSASTGRGYPCNVLISNNTILNYPYSGNVARTILGNLQIDAGSALYMDYGSPFPGTSTALTVKGNVLLNGNLSLGNALGGDLYVGGNWTRSGNTSAFNHNGKKVIFDNQALNADQTITTSNGVSVETFYDIETALNGGNLQLASNSNLTVLNNLRLNSGNLVINSNTINLNGTVTTASGSITGSSTSNIIVGGSSGGTSGALNFTSGNQLLNDLTISRAGTGAGAALGTDLDIKGTLTITDFASLTMGSSGQVLTISGFVSGNGTLTGSANSNLTIGGSGGSAGKLYFTAGSQLLNTLKLARTGSAPAAVMGTSLTANALMLNNGILSTGDNLLTLTTGSGITLPTTYTDSYVCLCNATGTAPISFTKPYDGSLGLRINNVGNTDNYFPVGVDFVSPNKMWLKNRGATDDITVALEKDDIGKTSGARVNRIWYVKQSNPAAKYVTADMRLYFTKRDWPGFLVTQDEIETGFMWDDIHLVQKNYNDPNYLNVAQASDVKNWIGAGYYNNEVYAEYSYGISANINNTKNGIDTFTRFSVVNLAQYILPVTIINFKAMKAGSSVKLDWTSLSEANVLHYQIEHSRNSAAFSSIGNVQASGKETLREDYAFTDHHPFDGDNYYRIKAVDKDGKTTYSFIVKINAINVSQTIAMYPNPAKRGSLVSIAHAKLGAAKYDLFITDANGKMLMTKKIDHNGGYFSLQFQLPSCMAAGTYFINLFSDCTTIKEKIFIQ